MNPILPVKEKHTNSNQVRDVLMVIASVYILKPFKMLVALAYDFLYQMAPFILGTLLDIGIGKRPVECINAILEGKEKPSASCDTKGLILYDIVY